MNELYVLTAEDRCIKNVGLQCGYSEAEHPLNVSGCYHDFVPGAKKYVKASRSDIEKAYKELE